MGDDDVRRDPPAGPARRAGGRFGTTYRLLWSGTASANLADGIVLSAGPLLAAAITRDPVLVSGLVVAQRLPWFLFTLISGALVDRHDRRRIMVVANLMRACALALLAAACCSRSPSRRPSVAPRWGSQRARCSSRACTAASAAVAGMRTA